MKHKKNADFIWADLSALDLEKAKDFYPKVLDWKLTEDRSSFDQIPGSEDRFGVSQSNYLAASRGGKPVAGIFDMPAFFRKINMPSFWMSYLEVDNIEQVVEAARGFEGVVVEVELSRFYKGQMALIRDPAGAGFTIYEGPSLGKKGSGSNPGELIWNELILDSADKVRDFYETVFGFKLTLDKDYQTVRYKVLNPAGTEIAGIQEVNGSLRGDKVYWLPYFTVSSMQDFKENAAAAGGELAYSEDSPYGKLGLAADSQGGYFGVAETYDANGSSAWAGSSFKYKTAAAMGLVALSIIFSWQWFWGIVFLVWIYPDLRSGSTYLVEPITRAENPVWYWLIMGTWITLSLLVIAGGTVS